MVGVLSGEHSRRCGSCLWSHLCFLRLAVESRKRHPQSSPRRGSPAVRAAVVSFSIDSALLQGASDFCVSPDVYVSRVVEDNVVLTAGKGWWEQLSRASGCWCLATLVLAAVGLRVCKRTRNGGSGWVEEWEGGKETMSVERMSAKNNGWLAGDFYLRAIVACLWLLHDSELNPNLD